MVDLQSYKIEITERKKMVYALLSPAKTMQFDAYPSDLPTAVPHFQKEAAQLARELQGYDTKKLMKLMAISEKLAALNVERFHTFDTKPGAKTVQAPAILAYRGDVYQGLNALSMTSAQLKKAQKHLGMITGLYGVLQPLDLIQPYRLEMSTGLKTAKAKDLYGFWGDKVTDRVNLFAASAKAKAIIGLASQEYQKAIDPKKLTLPFIVCEFKEEKNGTFQTVALFAKQARGMMARYIILNGITDPKKLQNFDEGNYAFNKNLSTDSLYVFTRKGKK
jgi:cytoplasmic iron level regulating protein YaaA (DUF328/UPF0246 family)